jgi:hypothetical protein
VEEEGACQRPGKVVDRLGAHKEEAGHEDGDEEGREAPSPAGLVVKGAGAAGGRMGGKEGGREGKRKFESSSRSFLPDHTFHTPLPSGFPPSHPTSKPCTSGGPLKAHRGGWPLHGLSAPCSGLPPPR